MRDTTTTCFDRSRRTVIKGGLAAAGGLALGAAGVDAAAAQDPGGKALMFNDEYRPGAAFRVVSPVIEETPDVEAVQEQNVFGDTNTRVIEYLNTGERVLFFPVESAMVEQGRIYEFSPDDLSVFQGEEGLVSVGFDLRQDVTGTVDPHDDYEVIDGGGRALVAISNFYPDALFRVESDVVDWKPRQDVAGSDLFTEYNTRLAEYRNSSDEFLLYPAHSATVERGALYVMRREFDVTEPEGKLATAQFARVDESRVNTPTETPSNGTTGGRPTGGPTTGTPVTGTDRSSPTEETGGEADVETQTDGQSGFGQLLAGLGITGGLLARELARRRNR